MRSPRIIRKLAQFVAVLLAIAGLVSVIPSASASAATSAGNLYAWGQYGSSSTPLAVSLPAGVTATSVSAGWGPTLAAGSDGKVYAFTTSSASAPTAITLPNGVAAVSVSEGDNTSLALGSNGTVYAWGSNGAGQLGNGTTNDSAFPIAVALPAGVTATAVSEGWEVSLAVGSDGKIYAWGFGFLGNGSAQGSSLPVAVTLPGSVAATTVAAGIQGNLALGANGEVYAWGNNGSLGNGTAGSSTVPVEVSMPAGVTATQIAKGDLWGLAVGSDGNVYAWGSNTSGEFGNGTEVGSNVPVPTHLPGGIAATAVATSICITVCGLYDFGSTLAIGSDGSVYAWGSNLYGQLGNGATSQSDSPVKVQLPDGTEAAAVSEGDATSVAVAAPAGSGEQFVAASPPLTTLSGTPYNAVFRASGSPTYAVVNGPAWLSTSATGAVTGTPPGGTTSFTYSVSATSANGNATAGPFTVQVRTAASITGHVAGVDGSPVGGALVQQCATATGWDCQTTLTAADGTFSLQAAVGDSVVLTAFGPPGSHLANTSTTALVVPAGGIAGVTIVQPGISPLPVGLLINGQSTPSVSWATPSNATLTGCPNGIATVSIVGQNRATGQYGYNVIPLTETPAGSGTYVGVIPPQKPIGGPVRVDDSISCPPQSALLPNAGPVTGGNTVYITGSGFTGATGVSFGRAPAASFTVDADDVIEAVAPSGGGTVPVTVTVGTSRRSVDNYTYVAITTISPTGGPASGGTTVDITGTGLGSATSVSFGDTGADFTQISANEIRAVSPPGTGVQDITVRTEFGGTTPVGAADEFTYGAGSPAGRVTAVRRVPQTPSVVTYRAAVASPASPHLTGAKVADALAYILSKANQIENSSLKEKISAAIDGAMAGFNPTCSTAHTALETFTSAAIVTGAVVGSALLFPELVAYFSGSFAFEAITFLAKNGLSPAVVVPAVTLGVTMIINHYVDAMSKAAVDSYFGACPSAVPPNADTLIDPSGTVLDTHGNPVSGATVNILRSDSAAGPFTAVDPASAGISPATNPETTAADGTFQWDVAAGFYEIQASAPGCADPNSATHSSVIIGPYPVPPPQDGLTITLACTNEAPAPVPVVQSLSQNNGPAAGGATVTILGTGFTPAAAVTFGGDPATVAYVSPEALSVVTPPENGMVDVRVVTAGGTSAITPADQFFAGSAPVVTGLSVGSGPTVGNTSVTVSGTGFTAASAVTFGGRPASSIRVLSDHAIQVQTPPNGAGTVDVRVVTPGGTSAGVAADQFVYSKSTPTTTLAASRSSVAFGAESGLQFQAVVTGVSATAPTGEVVVTSGATTLCTTRLTAIGGKGEGKCSPSRSSFGAGRHDVTAHYEPFGDPNYGAGSPAKAVRVSVTVTTPVKPQTTTSGYWMLGGDGHVYAFGSAGRFGSAPGPVVAIAARTDGTGYWTVDAAGNVSHFGTAGAHGGTPALRAGEHISTMSATPSGNGYWLFTNRGSAFPYGDAHFYGDMSAAVLNGPIVASVATPTGHGYYMVGSDGGVFSFGDAHFHGSTGAMHLNRPIVGISPTPDNRGYWLVASDGGVFAFTAPFRGSMGATHLNRPVNGLVAYGNGYLMVASDGGVFDFSNRAFVGSLGGNSPTTPIIGIAAS